MTLELALFLYSCFVTLAIALLIRQRRKKPKRASKRYEVLKETANGFDVDDVIKKALVSRYIGQSQYLSKEAAKAKKTKLRIDVFNIGLSSFVTILTGAETLIEGRFPFISVGLIVLVFSAFNTFLLSYSKMQGLNDRWLDSRRASELIQSELWSAFTQIDDYKGLDIESSLSKAIENCENIILSNTEQQLVASRQRMQQSNRQGGVTTHEQPRQPRFSPERADRSPSVAIRADAEQLFIPSTTEPPNARPQNAPVQKQR